MQRGPGRPVHAAGSSALPARPPGAGRAQLRRGTASPRVPSGAHSLCARGRTNCTALRYAAARIFLRCWGFFLLIFALVCLQAFSFFLFLLLLPLSLLFILAFRWESCVSGPGTDPPSLLSGEEEEPLRWLPGRFRRLGK